MAPTRLSESGRFIVIDNLHLDRAVFHALSTWAKRKELTVQDAIQVALCLFNDHRGEWLDEKKKRGRAVESVEGTASAALSSTATATLVRASGEIVTRDHGMGE